MKERSILLNTPMVRAILDGQPPVVRCMVNGAAAKWLLDQSPEWVASRAGELCKYGQPGDRLWVREETEAILSPCKAVMLSRYTADHAPVLYSGCEDPQFNDTIAHWDFPRSVRPGARMPRWARRILLEITDVRIELLDTNHGSGAKPWVWAVESRRITVN